MKVVAQETTPQCLLYVRSFGVTLLAIAGVAGLCLGLGGVLPDRLSVVVLLPFCLLGLATYSYELRGRHAWAIVRSALMGERFAACADAMRDAAPLVDLEVPGAAVVPYELVQWRDETAWLDFGAEVQRGLLLVSFPLEFVPGDSCEASALEFASAQLVEEAALAAAGVHEADATLKPVSAELRLRLRWPSGVETEAPEPRVLRVGPAGAESPCPGLLLAACLCLLGLVADLALLGLAEPAEWPVRKRFFTREGGRLGAITFSCDSECQVAMEGNPQELRKANRFWVKDEAHWEVLQREVAHLGPDLVRFRWLRRISQCCAVVLAATAVGRAVLLRGLPTASSRAPWLLAACGLAAGCLWCSGPLADWLARRRVQVSSERLGSLLPGGATVTASWVGGADAVGGGLAIEVEHPRPSDGAGEELPVLRTTGEPMRTKSSTLCNPHARQWTTVPPATHPSLHRTQTA